MERLDYYVQIGEALGKVVAAGDRARIGRLAGAIGRHRSVNVGAIDQLVSVLNLLDQAGVRTEGWRYAALEQPERNPRAANLTRRTRKVKGTVASS